MKPITWAGASLMMVLAQFAGAQAYPNKPIRWVIPLAPGVWKRGRESFGR